MMINKLNYLFCRSCRLRFDILESENSCIKGFCEKCSKPYEKFYYQLKKLKFPCKVKGCKISENWKGYIKNVIKVTLLHFLEKDCEKAYKMAREETEKEINNSNVTTSFS